MPGLTILLGIFIFAIGLVIGSFLNCVIYRLEHKKSLSGRSFCPQCRHTLLWPDLFPVFSFIFLRGKCRYCKAKISWQYPIVELATGIIFLLIFLVSLRAPARGGVAIQGFCSHTLDCFVAPILAMTLEFGFLFYVASVLIVIFMYDLKHYIIPDKILFPAIIITGAYRVLENLFILNYLLAVLVGAGFFLAIFLISRGRWMGFGDVKLAVLMGLLLGFPNIFVALFLAFLFGAVIGIFLMLSKSKKMTSEIPFGPFLITGTFIAMLWGPEIIKWYLNTLI